MTEVNYETELLQAGESLGEAMASATDEEKEILREMKNQVDLFAQEEERKGRYLDRSALFAAGIIAHPDISSQKLIEAAKEYIDKDYMFVKSLSTQPS